MAILERDQVRYLLMTLEGEARRLARLADAADEEASAQPDEERRQIIWAQGARYRQNLRMARSTHAAIKAAGRWRDADDD
jgi:hypothetical protein